MTVDVDVVTVPALPGLRELYEAAVKRRARELADLDPDLRELVELVDQRADDALERAILYGE